MENQYETLYKFEGNFEYDENEFKFAEISDKTFKLNNDAHQAINKNRQHILEKFTEDELKELHRQIIPIEKIKKDILTYDFINGTLDYACKSIDDIFNLLINELKLYQWKIGGFEIEDIDWIECTETNRFKSNNANKIQRAIYNTIEWHDNNNELKWFLMKIIERISNTFDKTKFKLFYKTIKDKSNEIIWILMVIEKIDTNIDNNENEETTNN